MKNNHKICSTAPFVEITTRFATYNFYFAIPFIAGFLLKKRKSILFPDEFQHLSPLSLPPLFQRVGSERHFLFSHTQNANQAIIICPRERKRDG